MAPQMAYDWIFKPYPRKLPEISHEAEHGCMIKKVENPVVQHFSAFATELC